MQKKKKFQLKYSSIYLPILHTCGYHYLLIFETAHQFIHGGKEQRRGGRKNYESKTLDQCRPLNSS